MSLQRTLKTSVKFTGIALHSGKTVQVTLRPAVANSGIVFHRTDLASKPYIKATPDAVFSTALATMIGTPEASVSTIEHLMCAFFAFGIDNAVVSLDSPELPIMDGSSAPFLALLDEAGVQELHVHRKVLVIKKAVEVVDPKNPSRFMRIEPSTEALLSYSIDFQNAKAIGKQQLTMKMSGDSVCEEIAFARTFCLKEEVDYMHSKGLAKGGSMDNAVVVSSIDGVLNSRGLRSDTEFVRHKMLDCIGDLSLIGMPIMGHVIAHKAGHDLHTQMAKKLILEIAAHQILETQAKESKFLKALLQFPSSLESIQRNLVSGLAIG